MKRTTARAAKPVSAATRALLAEMTEDADAAPPADKLKACADKIVEWRRLDMEIADLQASIREKSLDIAKIRDREIVELFDAAGIDHLGVPAEGNLPPYDIRIKEFFHANVPEDNMERAAAWAIKTENEDLIKTSYKIEFGLGEKNDAEEFEKKLEKLKVGRVAVAYDKKQGIPWNTLTAFVKREFEAKRPLTKKVMEMLGATSGRTAVLAKQKKGK